MPEYIEREALVKYLTSRKGSFVDDYGKGWSAGIGAAIGFCEEFPAADVEPVKRGEWVPYGINPHNGVVGNWHCSVCNGTSLKDSDFCPNCGAKMKG